MYVRVEKSNCNASVASPADCTQSPRGLSATLAAQSGCALHVVAASLGHGSVEMTQRHWAQVSSLANAFTARVQGILAAHLQCDDQATALAAHNLKQASSDREAKQHHQAAAHYCSTQKIAPLRLAVRFSGSYLPLSAHSLQHLLAAQVGLCQFLSQQLWESLLP